MIFNKSFGVAVLLWQLPLLDSPTVATLTASFSYHLEKEGLFYKIIL